MKRNTRWLTRWITATAILALANSTHPGQGGVSTLPLGNDSTSAARLDPAPFAGGETLTFSVSWMKIVGGTATMTVTPFQPFAATPGLKIVSKARSNDFFSKIFYVNDHIESWIDARHFRTLRYQVRLREGSKLRDELIVFDAARNVALHEGEEVATRENVQDTLSSFYLSRCLDLTPGSKHEIPVNSGGKNYEVVVDVLQRETLKTAAGTWKTVKVEPKMSFDGIFRKRGRLFIWITDDERRLPVLMRSALPIGSITATLVSYEQQRPAGVVKTGAPAVPAANAN